MAKEPVKRIELDNIGKPAAIIARLESLEAEEKKRNPDYKVPDNKPISR